MEWSKGLIMQTPRKEDEEIRYLETCPACGASNGVNATECWRCEGTLRAALDDEPSLPRPNANPGDDAPSEPVQPSFFPVFREAQSEPAANDAANTHWMSLIGAIPAETGFPGRANRRNYTLRRWAIGASLIAGAAGLAWFMPAPPPQGPTGAVAPLADVQITPSAASKDAGWDTTASPNDTSSQQQANGSPPGPAAPAQARPTQPDAAVQPAWRGDGNVPAPPPVRAPCTPQVAALGLCTPEPR